MKTFERMIKNQYDKGYQNFDDLTGPEQYEMVQAFVRKGNKSIVSDLVILLFPSGIEDGIPPNLYNESLEEFVQDLLGNFETVVSQLDHEKMDNAKIECGWYHDPFSNDNEEHRYFDNNCR